MEIYLADENDIKKNVFAENKINQIYIYIKPETKISTLNLGDVKIGEKINSKNGGSFILEDIIYKKDFEDNTYPIIKLTYTSPKAKHDIIQINGLSLKPLKGVNIPIIVSLKVDIVTLN